MRYLYIYSIIFVFLFFCSSCSNKQYQVLFQQTKTLATQVNTNIDSTDRYRIKAQDVLHVRNLQDDNALLSSANNAVQTRNGVLSTNNADNREFQVEEDGSVILPAIGRIKVAGLTRLEAQKLVEDAYRKNVLVNPIIELKIISLKVTIFGEVKMQGSFPLTKEHTTLVEMIGAAGGITEKANENNIKIIRGSQQYPQVTIVDLGDITSINDPKAVLQNGDIIYVAQNKRAARADNFQSFSGSIFQPALLLLNTALIIFTFTRR